MIKKLMKKVYLLLIDYDFFSNLMKHYVVHKYIRMNQLSLTTSIVRTPWVCEFQYDLDRCIDYIHLVFNDYFRNSGLSTTDIIGKTILEIGPGENLGVALKLVSSGAEKVVCVDRFNSLIDIKRQREIYGKLISTLNQEERNRIGNAIVIKGDEFTINPEKILYLNVSADKLDSILPHGSFDFVISRAVLEHVLLIDPAMNAMDLLLKKGGYMLHEVDFRDHGIFTNFRLHCLTFLSIDDKQWLRMTSNIGAPNRRMLSYYQSFFSSRGYVCDSLFVRLFGSDTVTKIRNLSETRIDESVINKGDAKFQHDFKSKSAPDMVVAAAFFTAKKQYN